MSMKHTKHHTPPIDINNKKQLAARLKQHGVEIELKNEHNMRIAFWQLVDKATGYTTTMGFDSDVLFVLDRLEQKGLTLKPGLQAVCSERFAPAAGPVRSSSAGNLTGGPFCVVCDTAGGLPCPAMVRNALKLGIKLAYPPGDARLVPNHVHPGRCRKRLKAWIEGGTQLATGKAPPAKT